MRWTVCVRSCTRSEGCLTMIDTVLDCSDECKLQRQHSVLMRERRALIFEKHQKKCRCPVNCIPAPMPLAPDPQNTRRARMTRRPPVSECRDETTCLHRSNGRQSIPRPNTTESKTLQSGTAANTSTDVSRPETCDEQTQPRATVAEQPRAHQSEHP